MMREESAKNGRPERRADSLQGRGVFQRLVIQPGTVKWCSPALSLLLSISWHIYASILLLLLLFWKLRCFLTPLHSFKCNCKAEHGGWEREEGRQSLKWTVQTHSALHIIGHGQQNNVCIPFKHPHTNGIWVNMKLKGLVIECYVWGWALQMCKIKFMRSAPPQYLYIYTNKYGTMYFWPYKESFSFLSDTLQTLCRALPNWLRCLSLGVILIRNKRGLENNNNKKKKPIKQAPCLPLWSVLVTAWWAISSSPTGSVSCAAGRQPERPPAPRMLAEDAGGPCSTWPHPGMTSAGRGKWKGPGGGGTVSSHRLEHTDTHTHISVFAL